MQNDQPSTGNRLASAFLTMGAWSIALISWQMICNPNDWLNIAPVGTPTFTIQMIVLLGTAVPFIASGLAHYFESRGTS